MSSSAVRTPAAGRGKAGSDPPPGPHPASARALLVTIFGLYARGRGGVLGVAALVKMLGALQVDESAARSLISRLKTRGILESVATAAGAGYGLTADGRVLLDDGDRRIFGRQAARLADGWLLAVFSVPESQRAQRHSLRSRLAELGFGTVSAGVWIAPAGLAEETADVLRLHRLDRYVELFTTAQAHGDLAGSVARWWDLDALAALYTSFLQVYQPVLSWWCAYGPGRSDGVDVHCAAATRAATHEAAAHEVASHGSPDGAAAFADFVRTVTAWRRLPYRDPGLPAAVLPTPWPGTAAAELFGRLGAVLGPQAERFVTEVVGPPAG